MTDEEKAEEIIKEKYCNNCEERETFPDIYNCSNKEHCDDYYLLKEGILLGLAEGRKELEQWKQEWKDAQIKANEEGFARTTLQIKYAELQKENAKLREYAKFLQGAYCGIKKENTELLESCRDKDRQLNKWFISYNEVIKENEELKKQEEIFLDRLLILQKTNGSLTDKINALEQQIEKLKCCGNHENGS